MPMRMSTFFGLIDHRFILSIILPRLEVIGKRNNLTGGKPSDTITHRSVVPFAP